MRQLLIVGVSIRLDLSATQYQRSSFTAVDVKPSVSLNSSIFLFLFFCENYLSLLLGNQRFIKCRIDFKSNNAAVVFCNSRELNLFILGMVKV